MTELTRQKCEAYKLCGENRFNSYINCPTTSDRDAAAHIDDPFHSLHFIGLDSMARTGPSMDNNNNNNNGKNSKQTIANLIIINIIIYAYGAVPPFGASAMSKFSFSMT